MKVFLSWSGGKSRQIAEIFKNWIPQVIQAAKPYFTPDDVIKGARWHSDISKELEESTVGLIFLTSENTNSQWLLFEAGALSKHLEKSNVCPICFDINIGELSGPLSHFQATVFSKKEIKSILNMINQNLEPKHLDKDILNSVFEKWWPELEEKINTVLVNEKSAKIAKKYTESEMLEQILELSKISVKQGNKVSISEQEIQSFIQTYHDLIDYILDYNVVEEVKELLKNLYVHISKVVEISGHSNGTTIKRLEDALDLLERG